MNKETSRSTGAARAQATSSANQSATLATAAISQAAESLAKAKVGTRFLGVATPGSGGGQWPSRMNLILILTDQERPPMWLPADWESANLPNTTRLRQNGLSFTQAFCVSAMCTPSRNSIFTGLFPAQHHATDTLTENMQQTTTEPQLDPTLPNLATCLKQAGYDVVYKGKWHLSHGADGADGEWIEDDISRYGFDGWDAPDSGGDTQLKNFGGGYANSDQRYVDDAKTWLANRIKNPTARPFCLIVSLVNPHDVLSYPGVTPQGATTSGGELPPGCPPFPDGTPAYIAGGYDDSWLAPTTPPIPLPPTVTENLAANYKPAVHANILAVMAGGMGVVNTPDVQQKYLNFYGRLQSKIDGQIGEVLALFDTLGEPGTSALKNTVIIRTSDHGENALCHGGLRQKTFVAYDEALRVPLIYSNPVLYPQPVTSSALVSQVDLLPTLCQLTGVPNWQTKGFKGVDYSSIVLNPAAPPVQDYVLFTFDDIYAGSDAANFPLGPVQPPNRIQMIRTADYKYARYWDADDDGDGQVAPDDEEFYDLRPNGGDYDSQYGLPLELQNFAATTDAARQRRGAPLPSAEQVAARDKLKADLKLATQTRLAPRSDAEPVAPEDLKFEIKRWDDPDTGSQAKVQITFLSRLGENYQLQKSTDLVTWSSLGDSVPGNNGLVVMSDTLVAEKAFYQIQWGSAA